MLNIPQKLFKGDSITWHDDAGVDNEGNSLTPTAWFLKYALRHPTATAVDLVATADGDRFKTVISTTVSGNLTVGTYYWEAYFVDSLTVPTKKITASTGELVIGANISTSTNYDGRSQTEKDLQAVEGAITAMAAGNAVQSYTIGTRSINRMTVADLIKLRAHLKYRLAAENRADSIKKGLGDPHNLFVRFNK
jgi:hypothetical protein